MTTDQVRALRADMAAESDADLLIYMALAGEEPDAARAAWEELYRRHAEYLYAVCVRAYGPLLGGQAGACDLVSETFQRAYEHAEAFDAAGVTDPDRLRRRVRAWLGRIAQRLAQTALRGRSRLPAWQVDHLHEAEDESQQWPDLHTAIPAARRAFQQTGQTPLFGVSGTQQLEDLPRDIVRLARQRLARLPLLHRPGIAAGRARPHRRAGDRGGSSSAADGLLAQARRGGRRPSGG